MHTFEQAQHTYVREDRILVSNSRKERNQPEQTTKKQPVSNK